MSVANAYARALYEAAVEAKAGVESLDQVEMQLSSLQEILAKSREARIALFGPLITAREKVGLVRALAAKAAYNPLVTSFLELLARKNRVAALAGIRDAFRTIRLHHEGGLPGKLVSADPMDQADIDDLAQAFSKKLGKRVAFQTQVDSTLLAGVKVTVNGVTYDGTLRSELQRLRDRVSRTRVAGV